MVDIVGVRFKRAGRVYYFDPVGIDLEVSDCVVVKTTRGLEIGQVVIAPHQVLENEITEPLKPVERKVEEEDIKQAEELENKEKEVLEECGRLISQLGLPMKLICAEYNLEGNRCTILFTAEDRIDFRELVRELTKSLKVKVELRQVGPRDEARLLGGFGRCGRPLCCMSFLAELTPVSIRMAKEQNLPLNPMKISGMCGRLLCCLAYETEQYRAIKKKLPRIGQQVSTPSGEAVVTGTNPLKETVMVELESGTRVELPLSELAFEDNRSAKRERKA